MVDAIRVVLDEANLIDLLSGLVVTRRDTHGRTVEVALSDIGWDRMRKALDEAMLRASERAARR